MTSRDNPMALGPPEPVQTWEAQDEAQVTANLQHPLCFLFPFKNQTEGGDRLQSTPKSKGNRAVRSASRTSWRLDKQDNPFSMKKQQRLGKKKNQKLIMSRKQSDMRRAKHLIAPESFVWRLMTALLYSENCRAKPDNAHPRVYFCKIKVC